MSRPPRDAVSPMGRATSSGRLRGSMTVAAAVLLTIVCAVPAAAQTPPQPLRALMADPLVPAGRISLDFSPSWARWDSRYGRVEENGTEKDVEEPLGTDLTDPTTESLFPGLATLQESLRTLTGQTSYQNVLGATSGAITQELTRIDAGLRIGVFDWLTLGVTVPYVKSRAAVSLGFIPAADANLGANPYGAEPASVSQFITELSDAAGAADVQAETVCAEGAGTACDQARALASRASDFSQTMQNAYLASAFFPTDTSPVAQALQDALASLNSALAAGGVQTVTSSIAFAASVFSADDFAALPQDPSIKGGALESYDGIWTLGDVEVNGTLRLLHGEVRDSGAVSPRLAWLLTGSGMVRLPTGVRDDPALPFDQASGDGQRDIEGRMDAALRVGTHLDVRASARYGVQQSVALLRRIAPHEEILPPISTLWSVLWTPGNYQAFSLSPRWHVGEALALAVDLQRYHKGEDVYELIGERPPGAPALDATELARETGVTVHQIGVGLRYSTVELSGRGLSSMPVELGARIVSTISGSGGNVPITTRAELSISLMKRIWGSN